MKKWTVAGILNRLVNYIEMFVSAILIVAVIIMLVDCIKYLISTTSVSNSFDFNNFLSLLLNLIIGLEFTRMLCKHTPGTILDVVLFATARQLIVAHENVYEAFLGVISICIIFFTRKYLLPEKDRDRKLGFSFLDKIKEKSSENPKETDSHDS